MQIPNAMISPIYPSQSKIQSKQNPSCSTTCSFDFMISSSFLSGTDLGTESSLDARNDDGWGWNRRTEEGSLRLVTKKKKKNYTEFPPPIPLLARTENLPAHMPWILKRHYTSDGRLILTEEKVKHHEYFRAHRSNGRLRLQLVPLDNEVSVPSHVCGDDHDDDELDDEDCSEYENDEFYGDNVDAYDYHDDDDDDDDDGYGYDCRGHDDGDGDGGGDNLRDDFEERPNVINSTKGPGGKCLKINTTVGTGSSSFLGMPVPATRWVTGLKANANGSTKGFEGEAGFGGLFRNHVGQAVGAFSELIGVSIGNMAELSAMIMFFIATAWKKGWQRSGWKQILSWSYLFSLNPILLLGFFVLNGDIALIGSEVLA